jgi:thioredoxin-related protein
MKVYRFILISFIILASYSYVNAQDKLNFEAVELDSLLLRSKIEKKPIFYMVYTDWCPYCNNMKATTMIDPEVISFLNSNYIFAGLNFESPGNTSFKETYDIKTFPTFLMLNGNGEEIARFTGETKKEKFLTETKLALNPRQHLPFLKAQYESNKLNGANCLRYLVALKKGRTRKEINPIAHEYFENVLDENMINEINWRIFTQGVSDIESREYKFIVANQDEYVKITSQKRVNDKFINSVAELMKPAVSTADTENYKKLRAIAATITSTSVDSLLFKYDLEHYETTNSWENYKKVAKANIEKYAWTNPKEIQGIALTVMRNSSDSPTLNQSLAWIKHANSIEESYDGLLIEARVYRKLNNFSPAIELVKKAKLLFSEADHTEADKILTDLIQKQKSSVKPK